MTDRGESRRVITELSLTLLQGARQVAAESDAWFLATVRGLDKGTKVTKGMLAKVGGYVLAQSSKLRPRWLRGQSQHARIHRMLMREARRSKVVLSKAEFEQFSQRIALVIELVLSGGMSIADIAFEQDERSRPLDRAPY
jgi:hypothetical protein